MFVLPRPAKTLPRRPYRRAHSITNRPSRSSRTNFCEQSSRCSKKVLSYRPASDDAQDLKAGFYRFLVSEKGKKLERVFLAYARGQLKQRPALLSKFEEQDLFNEGIVKLITTLQGGNSELSRLLREDKPDEIFAYCLGALRRSALEEFKKLGCQKRGGRVTTSSLDNFSEPCLRRSYLSPVEKIYETEIRELARDILVKRSPKYHDLLERIESGQSLIQIGEEIGLDESTVRRTLNFLRQELKRKGY